MKDELFGLLYQEIGKRIKSNREAKNLTQEALAASIGISRASISNIEVGRQQTTIGMLYNMAESLDLNVIELLPSISELTTLSTKEISQLESILNRHDIGDELKKTLSDIIKKPN